MAFLQTKSEISGKLSAKAGNAGVQQRKAPGPRAGSSLDSQQMEPHPVPRADHAASGRNIHQAVAADHAAHLAVGLRRGHGHRPAIAAGPEKAADRTGFWKAVGCGPPPLPRHQIRIARHLGKHRPQQQFKRDRSGKRIAGKAQDQSLSALGQQRGHTGLYGDAVKNHFCAKGAHCRFQQIFLPHRDTARCEDQITVPAAFQCRYDIPQGVIHGAGLCDQHAQLAQPGRQIRGIGVISDSTISGIPSQRCP